MQRVRHGLVDEAELLNATDETDEAPVEVELNDQEPAFLRGLIKPKFINYRAPLPSQIPRSQNPLTNVLRDPRQSMEAQPCTTNSLLLAAHRQTLRNKDWQDKRHRDRRRQRDDEKATAEQLRETPVESVGDIFEAVEEKNSPKELGHSGKSVPPWLRLMIGDKPSFGFRHREVDIQAQRRNLPIYQFKDEFLAHVDSHPVTILVGETGSGKTTQIPQYLYEHGYAQRGVICCTQPRRVAAETLAMRVAEEFGCPCGAEVGYTVRFKDNTSSLTKIKYMTDGMLLREALRDDTFERYSVIILDEAHERSINTDVLFAVVKGALRKRPDLKVIVTSATLDTDKFCRFFGAEKEFYIQGRTHPVETLYLSEKCEDYIDCAIQTVMGVHLTVQEPGDILVFLTGQEEIEHAGEKLVRWMDELNDKLSAEGHKLPLGLLVLPCTATLPSEIQTKVFDPTPQGYRKVVLATNVAETSVTIDNLYFVIDSGFCKQNIFDPNTGVEQLRIVPISQAQARQRAGRAGRIAPGRCFRLYTEDQFLHDMEPTTVPEIQRSNLFSVVLQLKKVLGIGDVLSFEWMDPPSTETIVSALQKLRYLEALDDQGVLTPLVGSRLADLPVDPSQGRTLLAAIDLGCVEPVLTIVSMLAVQKRGIFYRPWDNRDAADARKQRFHQPEGDQVTLMAVYNEWIESGMSEQWCRDNFVKAQLLKEARYIREQLTSMLLSNNSSLPNSNAQDVNAVRKAIVAGYFFNAAKRVSGDVYVTLSDRREVFLHPSSALRDNPPKFVLFDELHLTTREYMREVMAIESKWLVEMAPAYYTTPRPGQLTKEQRAQRITPFLKPWEHISKWRKTKRRRK
jgi:ATP-dependent RNA helicase DHX8/PRP22